MEVLKCFKDLDHYFTSGKSYPVEYDSDESYFITDDTGQEHEVTKLPDTYGKSYKTWFEVVKEEEGSND